MPFLDKQLPGRDILSAANARTAGLYPLVAWVYLEPDGAMPPCQARAYRMTEESFRELLPALGFPKSYPYVSFMVCEHMGRLIE